MMIDPTDILRAVVLFEITVTLVFSVVITAVYVKRLRSSSPDTNLTWHVVSVATGFTIISAGVFYWTLSRVGTGPYHPSILAFLFGYALAVVGQYALYRRQAAHYSRGD